MEGDPTGDDGSGAGFGMGNLQMMGIMNALKTGDVRMDMFLAMCIPIVLRLAFDFISRLTSMWDLETWLQWFARPKNEYERFIVHTSTRNSWGGSSNLDQDTQNTILLKAIQLYMHHKLDLHFATANLDLTSMEDKSASLGYYDNYDDSDSDEDGSSSRKTLVGMLSKYKVIKKPPQDVWHELGYYGGDESNDKSVEGDSSPGAPVRLCIARNEQSAGKDNERMYCTNTFHFVSPSETAIDVFVDTAYRWYMDQLRSMEDNSRYLYELKTLPTPSFSAQDDDDDGGGSNNGMVYTRYKLSDEKTFDSLFFPQKDSLLSLIQHFTDKSGKYSIPGYPHKLGVLLHGPPGTGKTSLIKALAQSTGRSIVNVPLARISTNSELMSIFFDRKYYIQGEDVPVKLGFRDVIFVMEDVDAASKIVRRRDGKTTAEMVQTEEIDLPRPKCMWRMLLESSSDESRELVNMLMEKSDRLKEEATKPEVLLAIAQRMMLVPGLGLVGSQSNGTTSPGFDTAKALQRVGDKALESASTILDNYSTVDRFVAFHARAIKLHLDAGAEVDDDFVDCLLGQSFDVLGDSSFKAFPRATLSRDVSLTQTMDKDEAHLQENANWASLALRMDQMQAESKEKTSDKDKKESTSGGLDLMGPIGPSLFNKPGKDQLNLTGLLNVLDGVVDTPGRILIMTTNHPEMLDPALIRPGRIDKRIMLGYMQGSDVVSMLEHYFQVTLSEDQSNRVQVAIHGDGDYHPQVRMTPAQVEQMTAEHDEIEDMIQALEAKSHPVGTTGKGKSVATITYNV